MRSYRSYTNSNYLRKEDFRKPEIVTIRAAQEQEIQAPGKAAQKKVVLYFDEIPKGLVLNTTNGDALFEMTGCDDPEAWIGCRVELALDPAVEFAGKRVGGLRIRQPARVSKKKALALEPEDEAPF